MDPNAEFPVTVDEEWSDGVPACILSSNEIYGKHVMASRLIDKGELILEEFPLTANPSGSEDGRPFCLTCGRECGLVEVCSLCKWPICENHGECQDDPAHAESECPIFVSNSIQPPVKLSLWEYGAIEVLRTVLLRSRNPAKWRRILGFEAHSARRSSSPTATKKSEFNVNFILGKCKLAGQVDAGTVERVTGILAVNTFWAFPDVGRPMYLLFEKATFFAHDCDPNTKREIVEKEIILEGGAGVKSTNKVMCIQITATRVIQPGENITIYYRSSGTATSSHPTDSSVAERQKYLQENFYFTCNCNRCLRELKDPR